MLKNGFLKLSQQSFESINKLKVNEKDLISNNRALNFNNSEPINIVNLQEYTGNHYDMSFEDARKLQSSQNLFSIKNSEVIVKTLEIIETNSVSVNTENIKPKSNPSKLAAIFDNDDEEFLNPKSTENNNNLKDIAS